MAAWPSDGMRILVPSHRCPSFASPRRFCPRGYAVRWRGAGSQAGCRAGRTLHQVGRTMSPTRASVSANSKKISLERRLGAGQAAVAAGQDDARVPAEVDQEDTAQRHTHRAVPLHTATGRLLRAGRTKEEKSERGEKTHDEGVRRPALQAHGRHAGPGPGRQAPGDPRVPQRPMQAAEEAPPLPLRGCSFRQLSPQKLKSARFSTLTECRCRLWGATLPVPVHSDGRTQHAGVCSWFIRRAQPWCRRGGCPGWRRRRAPCRCPASPSTVSPPRPSCSRPGR